MSEANKPPCPHCGRPQTWGGIDFYCEDDVCNRETMRQHMAEFRRRDEDRILAEAEEIKARRQESSHDAR